MFDFLRKKKETAPMIKSQMSDYLVYGVNYTPGSNRPAAVKPIVRPVATIQTAKTYNIAKNTNIIRLHDDVIDRLRTLKGDRTFNDFISGLISNA